jgi:hypothetical protein
VLNPRPLPSEPNPGTPALPLVKIIELKWLLAGEGVHIHVERLQRDVDYARETLDQAALSPSPALRAAAKQLRSRLSPA